MVSVSKKKENIKIVKIKCSNCGNGIRNHAVLKEHSESQDEEFYVWSCTYQICKCQGCDTIRFRQEYTDDISGDYDQEGNYIPEIDIKVYPEESKLDLNDNFKHSKDLPPKVKLIYSETVTAINTGLNILSGGGLRAIVESICKDKKIEGKNLEHKVDGLKNMDFLTKAQADLLHEERYIGNKSLHEIEVTPIRDLLDGLEIVESMLKTIYVLPTKAALLKSKRIKKDGNTDK